MIIGITGTIGAGKGTVAEYLVKNYGFLFISARDVWSEEIIRRGLPVNRDTMVLVANELRAAHGSDYFARTAIEKAKQTGGDSVIESIRSIGEARAIKERGGMLWAVDADVVKRYERIAKRLSETDKISFEKFVADEQLEWENADPNKQNLKAVIAMADTVFTNNSSPKELLAQVEEALKKALKSSFDI